jgi:hypothetical protein
MKRETIKRIETHSFGIVITGSLVLTILLSLIGLLAFSTEFALGVIVGGVVAVLNHMGLYRSLKALLLAASRSDIGNTDEEKRISRGTSSTVFGFYLRIVLSGVIVFLALKGGWASPPAIFVGASVVVLNCFIVAMLLYKTD